MRIVKRLKLIVSGDVEKILATLMTCKNYFFMKTLETESQPNTVNFCLIIFRSVQQKYQETVDFLGEITVITIVIARETWLNNKTARNTFIGSGYNFVHVPRSEWTGLKRERGGVLKFGFLYHSKCLLVKI